MNEAVVRQRPHPTGTAHYLSNPVLIGQAIHLGCEDTRLRLCSLVCANRIEQTL